MSVFYWLPLDVYGFLRAPHTSEIINLKDFCIHPLSVMVRWYYLNICPRVYQVYCYPCNSPYVMHVWSESVQIM